MFTTTEASYHYSKQRRTVTLRPKYLAKRCHGIGRGKDGMSPLNEANYQSKPLLVRLLINAGAKVDWMDNHLNMA